MEDKNQEIKKRQVEFNRWWKKNHHRTAAHVWLTKHSRRIMTDYNVAPETWDHIKRILKKFNQSDHKRLHSEDAEFLWRITHPLPNERLSRLAETAEHFREAKEQFKLEKKAQTT